MGGKTVNNKLGTIALVVLLTFAGLLTAINIAQSALASSNTRSARKTKWYLIEHGYAEYAYPEFQTEPQFRFKRFFGFF